jgi:iron complex outermembrane receptor protein
MGYSAERLSKPVRVAMVAAVALSSGYLGSAFAQERAPRQLEEIVVTTELREASEATTAISMEVLTDEFLTSNDIKDIVDLQNAVPALQFFQNGSYVQANIRGVGNPSTGGPSEQVGVPVFFDGATQGEEMGIASGFFDVDNIQVLKGPQSTFVGQAAAGGAILINSERPNFDGLNGFIEATAATYGRIKVTGALNLPVSDTIAARVAYMGEDRDSFYTNAAGRASTGGEQYVPGEQDENNYRFSLLWEPNESFSLWTKYENSELHQHGIPQQPNPNFYTGYRDDDGDPLTPSIPVVTYDRHYLGPAPGTGTVGPNGEIIDGVPGPGGAIYDPLDPWVIANPNPQDRITEVDRVSVELNYTFGGGITFRSLSSNIQMDRLQVEGGDSLVFTSPTGFHLGPGMQTWSQEFNLISPEGQRLEWLLGLYRNNRHTELSLNIPLGNPVCGWEYDGTWNPCPITGSRAGSFYWTSVDDVVHTAFYGQLNFRINDALDLSFEGRYNDDDNVQVRAPFVFTFNQSPTAANPVQCPGQIGGTIFYCPDPTPNFDNPQTPLVWKGNLPTYKVGLNWEPSDGHFIYAFYTRGYKSGQSTPAAANQVTEEIVDDMEFGWKGTVRPGLYAELGVYRMDYTDMQLSVFRTAQTEARQAVTNIGDSRIQGIEGSLRAVFGNVGLNGSFGYTESELGEVTTIDTRSLPIVSTGGIYPGDSSKGCIGGLPQCFDYSPYFITLSGAENLFSPKMTYTFSVDYAIQMSNGATLSPSLSLNHSDSAFESVLQQPTDRFYQTDARDVLNFNLTYIKDNWNVQFFGTNITDELYIEGAGVDVLYGDPRVVGVRARMDF